MSDDLRQAWAGVFFAMREELPPVINDILPNRKPIGAVTTIDIAMTEPVGQGWRRWRERHAR